MLGSGNVGNSYLKNIYNLFKFNLGTLIKFEILYKTLLSIILIPFAILGFNLSMKLTGYTYLTIENIFNFLLNPITLVILILLIIYLTVITIFDIASIIILFDISYHEEKIGTIDLMKLSLNKCKKLFNSKNIYVSFLVLFLMPFLNFCISSNVIASIKIPEFIMDYIKSNFTLTILYFIVYLLLLSIMSKWLYSLNYMILENKTFKEARESSKKLIKGKRIIDIFKILLVQITASIIYIVYVILGILIITLFSKIKIIGFSLTMIVLLFIMISLILFSFISNAISYATVSDLFYKHKKENKEKITNTNYKKIIKDKNLNKSFKSIMIILIVLMTFGCGLFAYQVITGNANFNIEYVRMMDITAHRGASIKYPENTMAAFVGAKNLGADWIELDVQQTKDKKIVVSHDTNLKRVTGVDKEINDMKYDEIKKLDAGSFFDKKFKGEKIPLLSEVLEFAKNNNIRLNIELKPTGKEINFEKQVVDLIKKYNFDDRCVVTSQVYEVLKNIKKVDSNIKTVYVMSIAIGNITDAKYADAFSVEATNVNVNLVNQVHNKGKQLYAWTVNTEESINEMINMNVDNIITDNIELGKKLVKESKSEDYISEFIKNIFN